MYDDRMQDNLTYWRVAVEIYSVIAYNVAKS